MIFDEKINLLRTEKKIGLMTHVVIGYPTLEATQEIVEVMEKSGADFIELQIPFSDPLADGPVIMHACEQSLKAGTTVERSFNTIKQLSLKIKAPMFVMAYFNTVYQFGIEGFIKKAKDSGIQGLIIPDIPLEEESNEHFLYLCKKYNLPSIRLLSPTSTKERIEKNLSVATGFLYLISKNGTTGSTDKLNPHLNAVLRNFKKNTKLPIGVGFGISKPEHIKALKGFADIAIIGSAFIRIITQNEATYLTKISKLIKVLKSYT